MSTRREHRPTWAVPMAFLALLLPGAAEALPRPCAEVDDGDTLAAVLMAQRLFDKAWAIEGNGRATQYEMKPQPRNPFAIGALAATVAPEDMPSGVVLTGPVTCTAHEVGPTREIIVTYAAPQIRFHDTTDGWSRPLPWGRLMVVAVRPGATKPSPRFVVDARTILPPEAVLAHPTAGLPPLPVEPRKAGNATTRRP
ncbi:MAG: hypothetical protein KGP27_18370 [Hyphomicrobiales bacterium]|nr:hypothetical protein [Hyphomicrobiales bacterium]